MSRYSYGTLHTPLIASKPLMTSAGSATAVVPINQPKMIKLCKEERQPLLTASQSEPVNDLYDRSPIPPTDSNYRQDEIRPVSPTEPDKHVSVPLPFDHQPVAERTALENATSNMDTMIHLLKGNIGTGILAMPDAFRNAGLLIGLIGTLFMGAVCTHCMHMLVRCSHELCRRLGVASLSFADVAEQAFKTGPAPLRPLARSARRITNLFLCVTQLGFCCVYFVFVAANLHDFAANYDLHLSISTYLGLILPPMLLLSLVRNLKLLTPVSLTAALLTVAGLAITFFYLLQGLPRMSSVRAFSSWSQLPLYFGTAIYAFEGIGMVLPLENNMKTPQDFGGWTGVLNTGMVIVACLYTAVGFFGYLRFGEAVRKGSITLNLPSHDLLAQSVKLSMALAIFLSYGLQLYVPVNIIWPALSQQPICDRFRNYGEYILRVVLVLFTFCLAALIPNLGAVISLVGAVSSSTLAIIFPPIIELITFYETNDRFGKYNWILWKDIALIIFGLIGFGFGSYVSIANIIQPPRDN